MSESFGPLFVTFILLIAVTLITANNENNQRTQPKDSSQMRFPTDEVTVNIKRPKRQISPTTASSLWIMPTLGTSRGDGRSNKRTEIVAQVEYEPGIHHEGNTRARHHYQEENTIGNENIHDSTAVTTLLRGISDQISTLVSIEERMLQRLENVEYRMTKLEVQTQEKSEFLRTHMSEIGRKVDSLDWDLSKVETLLDVVRQDMAALRQEHADLRRMMEPRKPISESSENAFGLEGSEYLSKLQIMMATIYNLRGMTSTISSDVGALLTNVSDLANATSNFNSISNQLVTKQFLRKIVLDHFQESQSANLHKQYMPLISKYFPKYNPSNGLTQYPEDCEATLKLGNAESGIYMIQPQQTSEPFFVNCHFDEKNKGWLVFHNRFEGAVDFYREWQDYKHGFGNLGGEFWLGLEKLHLLTNQKVYELQIQLEDFNLQNSTAQYSAFAIGSELEGYSIKLLSGYDGDAGDSLIYHAGMKFSTHDEDNDNWPDGNCAQSHTGAWWYNGCDTSNLNGRYLNGVLPAAYEYKGMYWYDWHGPDYSLQKARMMIRPRPIQSVPITKGSSRKSDDKPHKGKGGKGKDRNKPNNIHVANSTILALENIQQNVHDLDTYIDDPDQEYWN